MRLGGADTRAADEKALRDADAEFAKVGSAKDLEKIVGYYADDATIFIPNTSIAMGKPSIRQAWTSMLATPGFGISWAAMKAEASKSGDLGYTFGTYTMMMNDATGKTVNDRGKYVTVWKKQADGTWKVVADIFNSDLPAPPAATK